MNNMFDLKKICQIITPVFLFLIMAIFTGCFVAREPFNEIKNYDLGRPNALNLKESRVKIRLNNISTFGGYKYNMVFRLNKNEIFKDDFNKWNQPPERLLETYLLSSFIETENTEKNIKTVFLDATILYFEADCSEKDWTAILSVEYSLYMNNKQRDKTIKIKTYTTKIDSNNASSFAQAMSINAAKFAEDILSDSNKIANQEE